MKYSGTPVTATETVAWEIRDPSGTSARSPRSAELDPDGMDVGMENPSLEEPEPVERDIFWHPFIGGGGGSQLGNWGCSRSGINTPCDNARFNYDGFDPDQNNDGIPDDFDNYTEPGEPASNPFIDFTRLFSSYHDPDYEWEDAV